MKRILGSLILAVSLFSPALFAQESTQADVQQVEVGLSYEAQADFAGRFDGFRGRGVTCRAYDNGWEEHWGGHSSCEACMQDHHGSCTEICSATQYECVAVGVDRRGGTRQIPVRAPDRWSAEREALNRCSYRLDNCRIESCDQRNEEVSRSSCR